MIKEYEVLENTAPTLEAYTKLCISVGWGEFMNFEVAERSIQNSIFSVIVKDHHNKTIGMGRIVGDGAIYFYIQDVAVLPEYQGKGIGKVIMNSLTNFIKDHAPDKAFVGMFASEGKENFYEKFGFKDFSPDMIGMFKVNKTDEIEN